MELKFCLKLGWIIFLTLCTFRIVYSPWRVCMHDFFHVTFVQLNFLLSWTGLLIFAIFNMIFNNCLFILIWIVKKILWSLNKGEWFGKFKLEKICKLFFSFDAEITYVLVRHSAAGTLISGTKSRKLSTLTRDGNVKSIKHVIWTLYFDICTNACCYNSWGNKSCVKC